MSEREKAERKLLHLATAIEGITEGVLIASLDGTIEYVNNAVTGLAQHASGELVGRNIRDFSDRDGEMFFRSILDAVVAEAS
jgi:PAS domain-containing protein